MKTRNDDGAEEPSRPPSRVRRGRGGQSGLRWDEVPLKHYKETGTHFKNITRQVLFGEDSGLTNEVRYFEIAAGGHSTLEKHEHVHAVIVIAGRGSVLLADEVRPLEPFDLVHVPPMTWHQFHAAPDAPLGFLCLVPCERDRPIRPTEEEAADLRSRPGIGTVIHL